MTSPTTPRETRPTEPRVPLELAFQFALEDRYEEAGRAARTGLNLAREAIEAAAATAPVQRVIELTTAAAAAAQEGAARAAQAARTILQIPEAVRQGVGLASELWSAYWEARDPNGHREDEVPYGNRDL